MVCFIEECFHRQVQSRADGEALWRKWGTDKEKYVGQTNLTAFDFQHFSMHDESHSISILKYIELLLGRERITSYMGLGDLWLLLQCAYFHDIGMSLTEKQQIYLWTKDQDFKAYIEDRLNEGIYGGGQEMYEAASYYKQIDDLLKDQKNVKILDESATVPGADWPVALGKMVRLLVTDYVRQHHARRSREYFESLEETESTFFDDVIDRRLYYLVAEMSSLHTQSFDSIFSLEQEEIAFGDEHIHPQFVAALLRMGDVLDMDNNRFNVRVLEHNGALPRLSQLHLEKHKALTHFNVSPEGVWATAASKEVAVCEQTRLWFNLVEDEIKNLVSAWNKIAPPNMQQCFLREWRMEVYLDGHQFWTKNATHFNFDSRKMHKLLIGESIYDCRLDCLREYIQNAIDASKVRMWNSLKQENAEYLFQDPRHLWSASEVLPCDLKEDIFLRMPVDITLSYKKAEERGLNDQIHILIRDYGIGMDDNCIRGITTIGQGWRARKEYQDVFKKGSHWLQPTGGFGIGIQSAFMVTDRVEYYSRLEGASAGHHLKLTSPSKGGGVSDEVNYQLPVGTQVEFDIDIFKFLDPASLRLHQNILDEIDRWGKDKSLGWFSQAMNLDIAAMICQEYITSQIRNSLFPIRIRTENSKWSWLQSPLFYVRDADNNLKMRKFTSCKEPELSEFCYHISIGEEFPINDGKITRLGSRIILWSRKNADCVSFMFYDMPFGDWNNDSYVVAFKNIIVPKLGEEHRIPNISYYFDVMGQRAEECLQVNRSAFTREFEGSFYRRCHRYLQAALDILIPHYIDLKRPRQRQFFLQEDLSVAFDFIRMLFYRLSCLPLSDRITEALLHVDFSWGRTELDTIYRVFCSLTETGTAFKLVPDPNSNAVSWCVHYLQCFGAEDLKDVVFFTVTTTNRRAQVDMDKKVVLSEKYEDEFLGPLPEQHRDMVQLCREYYKKLQKNKTEDKELEKKIFDFLLLENNKFAVFSDLWQYCFKGFHLDYHYKMVEFTFPTKLQSENTSTDFQITVYVSLMREQNTLEDQGRDSPKWAIAMPCYDTASLMMAYPELALETLPYTITPNVEFRWVHLEPTKQFIKDLANRIELAILEEPNEDVILNKLRERPEFMRLVKWTYLHQYQDVDRDRGYRSYNTIERSYMKWVMDKLKQERSQQSR